MQIEEVHADFEGLYQVLPIFKVLTKHFLLREREVPGLQTYFERGYAHFCSSERSSEREDLQSKSSPPPVLMNRRISQYSLLFILISLNIREQGFYR